MGLVWRVLTTIAATNFVVMFVFVSLATLQFDSILSGLIKERLEVLATRARDPFASVIELGLPVSSVRNGRAALVAVKQSDPAIEEILVFEPSGKVVHTTSREVVGDVPPDWIDASGEVNSSNIFHLARPSQFIVGADIQSGGETVAVLAIVYSKSQARDQVRAMAAKLAFVAGLIMAATILLGTVAVRFSLSEHLKVFDGILGTYDSFARAFWRGAEYRAERPKSVSGLGVSTDQFWDLLQDSEKTFQSERHKNPQDEKGTAE